MTLTCCDCNEDWEWANNRGPRPKRCPACSQLRLREQQRTWRISNLDKARAASRRHAANNRDSARSRVLQHKYGITSEDFDAVLTAQGGKCAICGGDPEGPSRRAHFDHDHATEEPRGVLCASCNTKLGWLESRMDQILGYLANPPARSVLNLEHNKEKK